MDQPNPDNELAPVAESLFRGQKIEAIKLYRESHGGGLKEAKEAVELLERGLRETSPEKFTAASSSLGCATCMTWIVVGLTLTQSLRFFF